MTIMWDRKWNFLPCFCIFRDGKCQKQGRKSYFEGFFFRGDEKNAKTGKDFGIEGKKETILSLIQLREVIKQHNAVIVGFLVLLIILVGGAVLLLLLGKAADGRALVGEQQTAVVVATDVGGGEAALCCC